MRSTITADEATAPIAWVARYCWSRSDAAGRAGCVELREPDVLVQMADEVVTMIAGLEPMQGLQPHLDAVDRLKSEGDTIYRHVPPP